MQLPLPHPYYFQEHANVLPEEHSLSREVQQAIVNIYRAALADMMENSQLLRKSFLCEFEEKNM